MEMSAIWLALTRSPPPSVTTLTVGSLTSRGLVNSTPGAFLSPFSVSLTESSLAVSPADWLVGSGAAGFAAAAGGQQQQSGKKNC